MPRSRQNGFTFCPLASCSAISLLQYSRPVSDTSQICAVNPHQRKRGSPAAYIVLSVSTSARVAVIDSASDLTNLIDRYPRTVRSRHGLDFERLAQDYDGLHLTHEGYLRTRSSRRGSRLIGWDCESTLWFRWMFREWHQVQPYFANADRFDDLWLTLSGWSTDDYRCHRMPEDKASKKVYESMLREMAPARDRHRAQVNA